MDQSICDRRLGPFVALLVVAIALLPWPVVAQETSAAASSGMTPLQLVARGTEFVHGGNMTIYDLDVLSYFELHDQYDTELKRAMFEKSPECQVLVDSMKVLKRHLVSGRKCVVASGAKDAPWGGMSDYSTEKHGFYLTLGSNYGYSYFNARAPKSCYDFVFSSLPTRFLKGTTSDVLSSYAGVSAAREEFLFLSMSEETGLEVETDREKGHVVVLVMFNVTGVERVSFTYLNSARDYEQTTLSQRLLTTDSVQIVVGNIETGGIYFNKTY